PIHKLLFTLKTLLIVVHLSLCFVLCCLIGSGRMTKLTTLLLLGLPLPRSLLQALELCIQVNGRHFQQLLKSA
ncbi:hypothetical protein L9F63_011019, partial [Diploptera punctata]